MEAIATFALLIALQFVMTELQIRWPAAKKLISAPPSLLFYRGDILHRALRRERVTEADLEEVLREQGLGSFEDVEAIVLESDGQFSVIRTTNTGNGSALDRLTD